MSIPIGNTPQARAKTQFYKVGGSGFHRIYLYLREVLSVFNNQQRTIKRRHLKSLREEPQGAQFIDEFYEGQLMDYESRFPSMLLGSSFVSSVSQFENVMKKLCKRVADLTLQTTKVDSITQRVLDNCKKELESLLRQGFHLKNGFDADPEQRKLWEQVKLHQKLRDYLVHNQGTIRLDHLSSNDDGKTEALIKYCKANRGWFQVRKVRKTDALTIRVISLDYIRYYHKLVEEYLMWVISRMPKRKLSKKKLGQSRSNTQLNVDVFK